MHLLMDDSNQKNKKNNLQILPLSPFRWAFGAPPDLLPNTPWGPAILQLHEYSGVSMDPGPSPETIASTSLCYRLLTVVRRQDKTQSRWYSRFFFQTSTREKTNLQVRSAVIRDHYKFPTTPNLFPLWFCLRTHSQLMKNNFQTLLNRVVSKKPSWRLMAN